MATTLATELSQLATVSGQQLRALRELVNDNASDLAALTTSAKENLVEAVNEVKALVEAVEVGGVTAEGIRALGALMDDEITNLAALKVYDPATFATAAQGALAATAVQPAALTTKADVVTYTSAIFVATVGDDANAGTRKDQPKATIASAITAASALITGGAAGVLVHVMDGGTYTEDITVPPNVAIAARGATLVGTASISGGSEVYFDRHYAAANNDNMLTLDDSGTGPAIYRVNVSDGRGTGGALTGVSNVRNVGGGGKNLFAHVGILYVATSGTGVGDVSSGDAGHIHIELSDLYLAGNSAVGILGAAQGAGSSNVVGWIDHILEIGTPTSTVGVSMTAADAVVKLTASEIVADTAYNIADGSLYLSCPKITGTQTGSPAQLMVGTADATDDGDTNKAKLLKTSAAGALTVTSFTASSGIVAADVQAETFQAGAAAAAGYVVLWDGTDHYVTLQTAALGANVTVTLPSTTGTLALTTLIDDHIDGTHALTISTGVVNVDADNGRTQKLTLTGDVTDFIIPTNLPDGHSMQVLGKQDATGGRSLTLGSGWTIMTGTEASIGALGANAHFTLTIVRDGTAYLLFIAAQS